MPLIKKYENRRLYDTDGSRYVNLDDLSNMVRAGEDVRVIDAKSGRDLTREILLQVILESPGGPELLPVGMLRRVIRATGDDPLQRLVRPHLVASLELLHGQLDQVEGTFSRRAARAPAAEPVRAREPEPDTELDELRARLAGLEARLRK